MKLFVCNCNCAANRGQIGTSWLAYQQSAAAAAEDTSPLSSASDPSQNYNNNCSMATQRGRPHAVPTSVPPTVRARTAAHEMRTGQMSSTPRVCPLPHVSPAAAPIHNNSPVCQLPSPLVPCPCSQSASSAAVPSHISRSPPVTARPLVAAHPKQLPVYFMPDCRPNAIPQPTGYVVPFCQPAGSHPGFSPKPDVGLHGGLLPSTANGSQPMLRPVGMFQPRLPLSCPQTNGQPLPRVCMPSALPQIIPPPVCHVPAATGRNDVPLKSTNFTAVSGSMTVTDGLSPVASPDICASLSGMHLNNVDLGLLQDAMKEECVMLGVGSSSPAGRVTSCFSPYAVTSVSRLGIETASVESDGSLSDWSIIEMPSPPTVSSGRDVMQAQATVVGPASTSLMHFSSDSASSGPTPGRVDQFPSQKLSSACTPQPGSEVS